MLEKKDYFFEADISGANEGINCLIFERFCNFQIIGKNPKFKNIFFDEKSCKVSMGVENMLPENL